VANYLSRRLTKREKQVGVGLIILTAIAYTVIWFNPVFMGEKLHSANPLLLWLGGLALMAFDIFAIFRWPRTIVGAISMLIAFFAWRQYVFFPFPLLAYGAFTAFKRDAAEMARRREAMEARRAKRSSGGSSTPRTDATGRGIPVASKRYTPPRAQARGRRAK
jgi:hypothetical protein